MMSNSLTLGERIDDLMKEKGINNAQLAQIIDTPPGNLSKIRNGENTNPKIGLIIALAKYFNVTSDYLLGLSEYKTYQNAATGETLGISDENINYLKQIKLDDSVKNVSITASKTASKFSLNVRMAQKRIDLFNDLINLFFKENIFETLTSIKTNIPYETELEYSEDGRVLDRSERTENVNLWALFDMQKIVEKVNSIIKKCVNYEYFENLANKTRPIVNTFASKDEEIETIINNQTQDGKKSSTEWLDIFTDTE